MRSRIAPIAIMICTTLSITTAPAAVRAETAANTPVYDEAADGTKQIAEAVKTAKREYKNILLMFGANWCPWCLRLHKLFVDDKNIAAELKEKFVLVMIDVNGQQNAETKAKYGYPTKDGIPALVLLARTGKQLLTKDTSNFEEGQHHSPELVMEFLKESEPK